MSNKRKNDFFGLWRWKVTQVLQVTNSVTRRQNYAVYIDLIAAGKEIVSIKKQLAFHRGPKRALRGNQRPCIQLYDIIVARIRDPVKSFRPNATIPADAFTCGRVVGVNAGHLVNLGGVWVHSGPRRDAVGGKTFFLKKLYTLPPGLYLMDTTSLLSLRMANAAPICLEFFQIN